LAEKYYAGQHRKAPLIVKLNGKEGLREGEPVSLQITSVEEAVKLGAVGVGYTIYVGSEREPEMFQEFGRIEEEAHQRGLFVIGWMYPRGKSVANPTDPDVTAYAARIGLELGADLVKVHWPGSVESFRWVVKSAGKAGVLSSGGKHTTEEETYQLARDVVASGAAGMAIGRNVWEAKDPEAVSRKLHAILIEGKHA
jgi:class I fructose-bisphosphate aldolase